MSAPWSHHQHINTSTFFLYTINLNEQVGDHDTRQNSLWWLGPPPSLVDGVGYDRIFHIFIAPTMLKLLDHITLEQWNRSNITFYVCKACVTFKPFALVLRLAFYHALPQNHHQMHISWNSIVLCYCYLASFHVYISHGYYMWVTPSCLRSVS